MSSLWQRAMLYLGLVDEDQVDDAVGDAPEPARPVAVAPSEPSSVRTVGQVPGRRVEPPTTTRWRPANTEAHVESITSVRAVAPSEAESEIVVAFEFADAQLIADHLRTRTPVVLDLRSTEPEMVRRLVDFSSGLVYALDGHMQKIGPGVILVSPPRVILSREERQRLRVLGLYQLADDSG